MDRESVGNATYEVFDTMYDVLKYIQKEWNLPNLTMSLIANNAWQEEKCIRIVEANYNKSGDDISVGEELEEKCRAIRWAVSDGFSSFDEALKFYGVTGEEYANYIIDKDYR